MNFFEGGYFSRALLYRVVPSYRRKEMTSCFRYRSKTIFRRDVFDDVRIICMSPLPNFGLNLLSLFFSQLVVDYKVVDRPPSPGNSFCSNRVFLYARFYSALEDYGPRGSGKAGQSERHALGRRCNSPGEFCHLLKLKK